MVNVASFALYIICNKVRTLDGVDWCTHESSGGQSYSAALLHYIITAQHPSLMHGGPTFSKSKFVINLNALYRDQRLKILLLKCVRWRPLDLPLFETLDKLG